jgi:hypothetical protein
LLLYEGWELIWAYSRYKKQSKAAIQKTRKPSFKAGIIIRATDISIDEAAVRDRRSWTSWYIFYDYEQLLKVSLVSKVDSAVLDRIKKALALGNHENTSEEEARVAIRYIRSPSRRKHPWNFFQDGNQTFRKA